jgi:hypothetical protein
VDFFGRDEDLLRPRDKAGCLWRHSPPLSLPVDRF